MTEKYEDIEKMFNIDSATKKKIARGIHNMASRGKGFKGPMRTPVDYLKGKDKANYMGNSKVLVYNVKGEFPSNVENDIISSGDFVTYDTYRKLSIEGRAVILDRYLIEYGYEGLSPIWSVSVRILYDEESIIRGYNPKLLKMSAIYDFSPAIKDEENNKEKGDVEKVNETKNKSVDVSYDEFRKIVSVQERLDVLNQMLDIFKDESNPTKCLAMYWGVNMQQVYDWKYKLKKMLEKGRTEFVMDTKLPYKAPIVDKKKPEPKKEEVKKPEVVFGYTFEEKPEPKAEIVNNAVEDKKGENDMWEERGKTGNGLEDDRVEVVSNTATTKKALPAEETDCRSDITTYTINLNGVMNGADAKKRIANLCNGIMDDSRVIIRISIEEVASK